MKMTACEEKYADIQQMLAGERHAEALAALEALVAECDDFAPAYFDLGNLYYTSGRMGEALSHYEKTVALVPDNPLYLKNLADLLYSEGKDADGALELYDRILSLRPEDIQTLMVTGHLCVSLKRFDDALGYYNRVLDIEPWNDEAQQFVDRLMTQGVVSGAGADPETVYRRCQDLVNRGRVPDAINGLESLIAAHPDFALAHNDLGVLYYQRGDKERCLRCYEQAVSLEPGNANYQKNLADFYLAEQGEVEKALGIYLAVLNDNPEDIDALMVAGHICTALGKTESAKVFYDRVLDVEPWNLEASERLEQLSEEPS
jgi:tetratricopeptide (TPR) repeat protein